MTDLPRLSSVELAQLATAIRYNPNRDVRTMMAQQLFSSLSQNTIGTAQLCATLLAGLGDAAARALGEAILSRTDDFRGSLGATRRDVVDILFVTVKEPELVGCLTALGIDIQDAVAIGDTGFLGWHGDCEGQRALVVMVGRSGNLHAAMALAALNEFVETERTVLIGTAAGVEAEADVGDVVVGRLVVDYQSQRLTADGVQYIGSPYRPPNDAALANVKLIGRSLDFVDECWRIVRQIDDDKVRAWCVAHAGTWRPATLPGTILAGDVLYDDGSIGGMVTELGIRARAVEMEGAGFAAYCETRGWDWQVLRGISDVGEEGRSKEWQIAVSVAAAVCAKRLLGGHILHSRSG